jgi:hypothetical protein
MFFVKNLKEKINIRFFKTLISILFIISLGFYIFLETSYTVKSYYLSSYQEKIAGLNEDLTGLETNYSETLKLDNIEQRATALGFGKIEKVKFIKAYSTVVKRD